MRSFTRFSVPLIVTALYNAPGKASASNRKTVIMMATKEEVYTRSTMGHKVGFGKRPVIVCVDFQKGYTHQDLMNDGHSMFKECEQTKRLTDAAHKKNIRVVYTQQTVRPDGVDDGTFNNRCTSLMKMHEGEWNYELDEHLGVEPQDIIIKKHSPSAFFCTDLIQMLVKMHIDTVILCGCTMAGCVYATAIDSMSYGFRTAIAKDAVGDKCKEVYDTFLFNATYKYADESTVDECIEYFNVLESLKYDLLV